MSQIEERRSPRAKRIPVETLVEICGNQPGVPPFEAEAVDVSGRGMHVRTAYLPDVGDSLVCRFDSDGREIVVEGEVAWQQEGAHGGEFGIQFTALDSRSVEALRALCAGKASEQAADEQSSGETLPAGQKVRLHIEGLATPMKALVRDGSRSRVQVGSNLEFLKVGRALELESLDQGERRQAQIDSVTIALDPNTQVPQLVVALRFEDVEATPEPSVIDAPLPAEHRYPARAEARAPEVREAQGVETEAYGAESPAAPAAESDDPSEELEERLQGAVQSAGELAKQAGHTVTRLGAGAAASMGALFRAAKKTVAARRAAEKQVRRTAAPPSGVLSVSGKRVLHEAPPRKSGAVKGQGRMVKGQAHTGGMSKWLLGLIAVAGVAVVFFAGAWVSRLSSAPPPEVAHEPRAEVQVASPAPAAEPAGLEGEADEVPTEALDVEPVKEQNKRGVVADVPLFGPTPMATMEPAPLGPSPEEEPTLEELERAAANAVPDESFDKPKKEAKVEKKKR